MTSSFEDHLWQELLAEHGGAITRRPAQTARRTSRRPRLLVGTGLGLAGVGAGVALLLGTTATSPAFAVTRNHDGTVTISLRRSNGVAGANIRLRRLGIRATVALAPPPGCGTRSVSGHGRPDATGQWTLDPGQVPRGQTVVLAPHNGSAAGGRGRPEHRFCTCPTTNTHSMQGQGKAAPGAGGTADRRPSRNGARRVHGGAPGHGRPPGGRGCRTVSMAGAGRPMRHRHPR